MPTAKTKKLTEPLDILVEYGYLDDETPYHKAVSNAVNDFNADKSLGGEYNSDYVSILQKEAKKELKARRRKISADAFKKGSSVGGAQKVAADTTGASALAIRKPSAAGVTPGDVTPEEEKGGALAKPTESLIGPLKTIDNSVNSIVETLKVSNKADAKAQSDARKQAVKDARAAKYWRVSSSSKDAFEVLDVVSCSSTLEVETLLVSSSFTTSSSSLFVDAAFPSTYVRRFFKSSYDLN